MRPGEGTPRPDFVMVGGQSDGMFYLIASKSLTEVELRTEADNLDDWFPRWDPRRSPPRYRQFITAEMRDFVIVAGRDYAEAFRTLFEEWTPGVSDQPAIGEQPAITAARPAIDYSNAIQIER